MSLSPIPDDFPPVPALAHRTLPGRPCRARRARLARDGRFRHPEASARRLPHTLPLPLAVEGRCNHDGRPWMQTTASISAEIRPYNRVGVYVTAQRKRGKGEREREGPMSINTAFVFFFSFCLAKEGRVTCRRAGSVINNYSIFRRSPSRGRLDAFFFWLTVAEGARFAVRPGGRCGDWLV